jgi:hypothetical protein
MFRDLTGTSSGCKMNCVKQLLETNKSSNRSTESIVLPDDVPVRSETFTC